MNGDNPGGRRMDPNARPVIEDPTLPTMGEPPTPAAMGAGEGTAAAGERLMSDPPPEGEQAPTDAVVTGAGDPAHYPEMEPMGPRGRGPDAAAFAAGSHGEGYLRLVIEVEDGTMEVVDASVVDGPLLHTDLTGQMAYEALLAGRRVAADSFDDLSQQHAFPPPDDPTVGHRTSRAKRFQFVARVPRSEVTVAELADLQITLVRPSSTTQLARREVAGSGLSLEAAALDAGEEAPAVIARLDGVSLDALPPQASEAVRNRLR